MRIVLEPGSYTLENVGDVGMLQVAVRRLRNLWPEARIGVVTEAPQHLADLCPGTQPILTGQSLQRGLPLRAAGRLLRFAAWTKFGHATPPTGGVNAVSDIDAIVRKADLLVVSGMGALNDCFAARASRLLATLALAESYDVPAALLSQGLGPLQDPMLRQRVGRALARVDFIALRERLTGPALLTQMGVSPGTVRITGDDAIELAYEERQAPGGACCVGINVRVADYAGVNDAVVDTVRTVLADAATRLGAPVLPIPISHRHRGLDAKTNRALLRDIDPASDGGATLRTPRQVIQQIGRCRVVVAGSYHAGVFALAQGIPVVALVNSSYYADKFRGLADMFGGGCEVVRLGDAEFSGTLSRAIDRAWTSARHDSQRLLAAATEQITLGQEAYRDLTLLPNRRTPHARRHARSAN